MRWLRAWCPIALIVVASSPVSVVHAEDIHAQSLETDAKVSALSQDSDTATSSSPTPTEPLVASWRQRKGHRLTYELRANVMSVVFTRQNYVAGGYCATVTGFAPVSIYGQTGSARGFGVGAGLGLHGGYAYLVPPEPGATFWALRAGAGIDIAYLYVDMPMGIPDVAGELCAQVQRRAPEVREESGSMLLLRAPIHLGGQLGIGSFRDGSSSWSGVLVGAAWAPSLFHLEPSVGPRDTHFQWIGAEVTVDFVTLHASLAADAYPMHLRLTAFVAPPFGDEPFVVILSTGAAWY